MVKNKSRPTVQTNGENDGRGREHRTGGQQQPLSGSKQVKSRNHTRSNHGEGS